MGNTALRRRTSTVAAGDGGNNKKRITINAKDPDSNSDQQHQATNTTRSSVSSTATAISSINIGTIINSTQSVAREKQTVIQTQTQRQTNQFGVQNFSFNLGATAEQLSDLQQKELAEEVEPEDRGSIHRRQRDRHTHTHHHHHNAVPRKRRVIQLSPSSSHSALRTMAQREQEMRQSPLASPSSSPKSRKFSLEIGHISLASPEQSSTHNSYKNKRKVKPYGIYPSPTSSQIVSDTEALNHLDLGEAVALSPTNQEVVMWSIASSPQHTQSNTGPAESQTQTQKQLVRKRVPHSSVLNRLPNSPLTKSFSSFLDAYSLASLCTPTSELLDALWAHYSSSNNTLSFLALRNLAADIVQRILRHHAERMVQKHHKQQQMKQFPHTNATPAAEEMSSDEENSITTNNNTIALSQCEVLTAKAVTEAINAKRAYLLPGLKHAAHSDSILSLMSTVQVQLDVDSDGNVRRTEFQQRFGTMMVQIITGEGRTRTPYYEATHPHQDPERHHHHHHPKDQHTTTTKAKKHNKNCKSYKAEKHKEHAGVAAAVGDPTRTDLKCAVM